MGKLKGTIGILIFATVLALLGAWLTPQGFGSSSYHLPEEKGEACYVFVTKTGTRYHGEGCRYLTHSAKKLTLKEAEELGYVPCKICKPKSNSRGLQEDLQDFPEKHQPACGEEVAPAPEKLIPAVLRRVVDGDTIEVEILGKGTRVRLIGIDTPELKDRQTGKPEPFAFEAKDFLERILQEKHIFLELDVQTHDKYSRLLAYLWTRGEDGGLTFVNSEIIRAGYCELMTIPPNVKYADYFLKLYRQRRMKELQLLKPSSS